MRDMKSKKASLSGSPFYLVCIAMEAWLTATELSYCQSHYHDMSATTKLLPKANLLLFRH